MTLELTVIVDNNNILRIHTYMWSLFTQFNVYYWFQLMFFLHNILNIFFSINVMIREK